MQEQIYFAIVAFSALYYFNKNKINSLSVLVFLIFWQGLFDYFGKYSDQVWNFYKIFIVLYCFYFVLNHVKKRAILEEKGIIIFYIFFSSSFYITHIINFDEIMTLLSQFFFKYSLVFFIFFIEKELFKQERYIRYLKKLLLSAIFIQLFLSFAKISIYGLSVEYNVGSVEYMSAGTAVVLPIVILFFLFIIKREKRSMFGKLIYVLPIIIAFASMKRTPIFLYPIYFFLMANLFEKKLPIIKIIKYTPIALLIFYVSVITNKTLNPEHSTSGSFDLTYVVDYAMKYNFGSSTVSEIRSMDKTSGRGGSVLLLFEPRKLGLPSAANKIFGKGVTDLALEKKNIAMFRRDQGDLFGAATETLYSLGYAGLIFMLLMCFKILQKIKNKKLKWILVSFYLYEYFMYSNLMMFNAASCTIVIFIVFYANMEQTSLGLNLKKPL